MRPGAANSVFRKPSIARLSKSPVGNARASVANDSIMPSCSGSRRYWSDARATSAGNAVRRRRNSRSAGRRNNSGRSAASLPLSMKSRYICAGEIPLASAAATKLPDDTPT